MTNEKLDRKAQIARDEVEFAADEASKKFNWQGVVNRLRTTTIAYRLGFKAGAAWRDANPIKPQGDEQVPGNFECAKCGCGLIAKVLGVQTGTVGMNTKPQDCPNGCGPMWPITWKKLAKQRGEMLELMHAELEAARAHQPEVEKLVKALESLIEINDFEIRNRVWQEQWKAERFTKAREALRAFKGDK